MTCRDRSPYYLLDSELLAESSELGQLALVILPAHVALVDYVVIKAETRGIEGIFYLWVKRNAAVIYPRPRDLARFDPFSLVRRLFLAVKTESCAVYIVILHKSLQILGIVHHSPAGNDVPGRDECVKILAGCPGAANLEHASGAFAHKAGAYVILAYEAFKQGNVAGRIGKLYRDRTVELVSDRY